MKDFGPYKIRAVTEADHERLREWVAADPDHRDSVQPEFFHSADPAVECWALEDGAGVVLYFRLSRAVRVDIQFDPMSETPARTMRGLQEGFGMILRQAPGRGWRQMIFESKASRLIQFCLRRFGFQASPHEYVRGLPAPLVVGAQGGQPCAGQGGGEQVPSTQYRALSTGVH